MLELHNCLPATSRLTLLTLRPVEVRQRAVAHRAVVAAVAAAAVLAVLALPVAEADAHGAVVVVCLPCVDGVDHLRRADALRVEPVDEVLHATREAFSVSPQRRTHDAQLVDVLQGNVAEAQRSVEKEDQIIILYYYYVYHCLLAVSPKYLIESRRVLFLPHYSVRFYGTAKERSMKT